MTSKPDCVMGLGAVTGLVLTGCSAETAVGPPSETLASAIRTVGYACTGVLHSDEVGDDPATWRVACQDALVYVANVARDGRICITPTPYEDQAGLTGAPPIRERCTSVDDL